MTDDRIGHRVRHAGVVRPEPEAGVPLAQVEMDPLDVRFDPPSVADAVVRAPRGVGEPVGNGAQGAEILPQHQEPRVRVAHARARDVLGQRRVVQVLREDERKPEQRRGRAADPVLRSESDPQLVDQLRDGAVRGFAAASQAGIGHQRPRVRVAKVGRQRHRGRRRRAALIAVPAELSLATAAGERPGVIARDLRGRDRSAAGQAALPEAAGRGQQVVRRSLVIPFPQERADMDLRGVIEGLPAGLPVIEEAGPLVLRPRQRPRGGRGGRALPGCRGRSLQIRGQPGEPSAQDRARSSRRAEVDCPLVGPGQHRRQFRPGGHDHESRRREREGDSEHSAVFQNRRLLRDGRQGRVPRAGPGASGLEPAKAGGAHLGRVDFPRVRRMRSEEESTEKERKRCQARPDPPAHRGPPSVPDNLEYSATQGPASTWQRSGAPPDGTLEDARNRSTRTSIRAKLGWTAPYRRITTRASSFSPSARNTQ